MSAIYQQDPVEISLNSYKKANETLSKKLPDNHMGLSNWLAWNENFLTQSAENKALQQAMIIAYSRMALRNGILSDKPRAYHNESHINDLLERLMLCSKFKISHSISDSGWQLLSFFAATHDLRQTEPRKKPIDNSLVGANETASFQEARRITKLTGLDRQWSDQQIELLKTMIHGSTFGTGRKRSINFFQGNLAIQLLKNQKLLSAQDQQLVLLACDIDTANVSLSITQYANSTVKIFKELKSHQNSNIHAHEFFSEEQRMYFFELQQFQSEIGQYIFEPMKQKNRNKITRLYQSIKDLDPDLSDQQIIQCFKNTAEQLDQK
ncbi:MAG: hypothetical protein L3J52_04975 [Proteobacteria bacterium]|nr:hypothetical protein [Pseudomonadota bacterium]